MFVCVSEISKNHSTLSVESCSPVRGEGGATFIIFIPVEDNLF